MNYPQPGQYPGYPQYPGGGQMQVPAKPPIPSSVQNAFYLMIGGAALSVVSGLITIAEKNSIRSQIDSHNPSDTTTQINSLVNAAIAGAVLVIVVGTGLWLWMAFANRAGRNYARITGTVFFGISTLFTLVGLAAASGSSVSSVKASGLGTAVSVLSWLVGLATVILLWNRQSGPYFKPQDASYGYGYGYGYPQQPPQYPYPQQQMQPGQQPPYETPPQMQPPNDPWSTNTPPQ
jgi:hypothetical protein